MLDRLAAGDITTAASRITDLLRDRYQTALIALGGNLTKVVEGLGTLEEITMHEDFAEILISRYTSGVKYGYRITLLRMQIVYGASKECYR